MSFSRLRIAAPVATLLALVVLALALGLGSSGQSPSRETSAESAASGSQLPKGIRARDFALVNQYGRRISLGEYRGRVTVLSFLSSTCGPACVLMAQQIRGALDELPSGVPTLLISTDPAADTPSRIAHLLGEASLSRRTQYLRGTLAQLRPIWRSYGLSTGRPGRVNLTGGSAFVLLIDKRGFERVSFPLEDLTPEGLARGIRKLQSE